jgi:hypothetical protein
MKSLVHIRIPQGLGRHLKSKSQHSHQVDYLVSIGTNKGL